MNTSIQKSNSKHWTYLIVKRSADVALSLLALVGLSPVFLLVWLMNYFDESSQGPLLYAQTRIGLHGKKFKMYKFRSMVVNADEKLHKNKALYAKYIANNYKLRPEDDPRITKIGQFLRKTSIDEIPQFINILKGDMSLVGPRPVVEEELIQYDKEKLLTVKPGAMGLWQASGRSQIGYPKRANIEMNYIDHACVSFDLKIIWENLVKIFSGKGAF
ncbi:sugar transferase [Lactobacillus sp. LC28-10]|uniref:Sugar transferase n=1 Tax=Secundilactobacillus angelensis TaxID=2722706 RepID=A0ABX1KYT2_9LACO|nr:sugar transferase [Secundilactobacillus angelensis]MCH5463422.1 sugar transferase [Secundilactobacillus angelensis]NLR18315.1 sugar transferase [Secundilactobacillus angelensis]